LVPINSLTPTIDGWDQMLRMYGPLYVDIGFQGFAGTHAIIVDGISGDGSADGTTIIYIDPASGSTVTASSPTSWPSTKRPALSTTGRT
jgi:hypothetical protein